MKNIISKTDSDLVKVAVPFDSTGCLDNIHDGNLVGGGVGELRGVTVGWWVWKKDGAYSVRAVIPSHSSAEYCADTIEQAGEALRTALADLDVSFILPNAEHIRDDG